MTGPMESVLGLKKEIAINRFLRQTPLRYVPAENELSLCAVIITIEKNTGKATNIERLNLP